MKKLVRLLPALLLSACTPATSVIWTEGAKYADEDKATYTVQICNPPAGLDWEVWGSYFALTPKPLESDDCKLEVFFGNSCVITPLRADKDTLEIQYTSISLPRYSFMPEGFALHRPGRKDKAVKVEYRTLETDDAVYDAFTWKREEIAVHDMIPALKSVTSKDGSTRLGEVSRTIVEGHVPGWYSIDIDGTVAVEASDEDGLYYAENTLERLKENAGGELLPSMRIEDWPDFGRRGFMLDVARSFFTKEQVFTVIDLMARYKLNFLQFHLVDDEGWRLFVEEIPELTEFSGFHALPTRQEDGSFLEVDGLHPSYDGSFDRNDKHSNAHGFYTRQDLVEILRYAADRHIQVVPEIDTPGHSYAAIAAMEAYWRRTGDDSLRLVDPEEEKAFLANNGHRCNVLNLARPQTYKFIGILVECLRSVYAEAGVELGEIHLGGDEVAAGSWTGRPSCVAFMEEHGWTEESQLKEYYLGRLMDMLEPYGIKLDGWQEIAMNLSEEGKERLIRNAGYINVWSTTGGNADLPYRLADQGFPVMWSGAPTNYMDLAYNANRAERGLNWGGYVDEARSFSLLPFDEELSAGLEHPENILGVEAHLWSEQLRSMDLAMYAMMPKSLGVFDRAWNAAPSLSFDKFYTIVADRELPYLDSKGINHRRAATPAE